MRDQRKLHNAEFHCLSFTKYYAVMPGGMYSRKEKCIQKFGDLNWRKETTQKTYE